MHIRLGRLRKNCTSKFFCFILFLCHVCNSYTGHHVDISDTWIITYNRESEWERDSPCIMNGPKSVRLILGLCQRYCSGGEKLSVMA